MRIFSVGQICTEELLKKYPFIFSQEPKAKKWIGKQVFSSNGLVSSAFNKVGIKIYGLIPSKAADKTDWESYGRISNFPNKVCILYRFEDRLRTQETGIYIGNGEYIQAKGYEEGVIKGKMPGKWTDWAIPKGLYDNEPIPDKPKEKITWFPYLAKVIVSSGRTVDIRKSPSKNSSIVIRILVGEYVTITGEENDWYKVTYGATSGYIMKEFLRKF